MTGRPDYDVGDLVVCVRAQTPNSLNLGKVWRVVGFVPPDCAGNLGVLLEGRRSSHPTGAFQASGYRKIDPKPPEFWTGEIEVETREGVDA
jgi:hypothetical protein